MANNYYDATGVLVLANVTPVIKALFGAFNLDASLPGDGKAYIAKISEDNEPNWDEIRESLIALAQEIKLTPPAQLGDSTNGWLHALTASFCAENEVLFGRILEMEDSPSLTDLYEIALQMDDGHDLQAIQFEGCWHCDKPRLFEFGGYGEYIGRNCVVSVASNEAASLGSGLDAALCRDDADEGAGHILVVVHNILNGVRDEEKRQLLKDKLSMLLAPHKDAGGAS